MPSLRLRERWNGLNRGERIGVASLVIGAISIPIALFGWILPKNAPHNTSFALAKVMQSTSTFCFRDGPDHPDASLTLGRLKATETNSPTFIQCGNTDHPELANGTYRFGYHSFPSGSTLERITARVGVDEASSSQQTRTHARWTVQYRGKTVCTVSASFGHPQTMECDTSIDNPDLTKLRIIQAVDHEVTAAGAGLWAGMIDLTAELREP
jgi:hypothetical protein